MKQINRLCEAAEAEYEKEKLNERAARLSGGVAIIQCGAQTETELKEKKLRVEDALNATKAAVEEGIVIGGGCTLLKLAAAVDDIKKELPNDEQKLGADIIQRALKYPMRLIAANAGDNGSVVVERVTASKDANFGYNAATGEFQDLMVNGIIDPTKVVRTALQDAASVAGLLVTTEAMVAEKPEKKEPMPGGGAPDMGGMGF